MNDECRNVGQLDHPATLLHRSNTNNLERSGFPFLIQHVYDN
jgi:hypothetical protein